MNSKLNTGRKMATGLMVLAAGLATLSAQSFTHVIPSGYESIDGNYYAGTLYANEMRHQVVYSSGNFPGGLMTISEIRFRRDINEPAFNNVSASVLLRLSTTSRNPGELSTTFAQNSGPDETVVYNGSWIYSSPTVLPNGTVRPFEIRLPLTTPFTYNPADGNLLFDLRISGIASGNWTDGVNGSELSRAELPYNASATTGALEGTGDVLQLVYQTSEPFTKVTTGSIVTDSGEDPSAAWADVDGNGTLDVFVANTTGNNHFYLNNGDGTFTSQFTSPLTTGGGATTSAAWGDYDNDGFLDLFAANRFQDHFLFRGTSSTGFVSVANSAVIAGGSESYNASWVDFDNDGYLDLYVCNAFGVNFLYRNNGNGTFTKNTSASIANLSGAWVGSAWGDFNGDGRPDLFIADGGGGANALFANDGDGNFTRILTGAIATDVGASESGSWADYDNDGDLDLFVANRQGINFLYRNDAGSFTRVSSGTISTDSFGSNAGAWGDFDNDGWLDLYVAQGEQNSFYRNNQDGTFSSFNLGLPTSESANSLCAVWVDFDSDGALDLHVSNVGQNWLYRNNGATGNWLKVRLIGGISNRAAIGAKVRVQAQFAGEVRTLLRAVTGDGSFHGQNLELHFGLGNAQSVNQITVEWPSGTTQYFPAIGINQQVTISEGNSPTVVTFLPSETVFTNSVQVSIQAGVPNSVIRYTTNGDEPTEASAAYSDPFTLTETATVKARLFVNGFPASEIVEATYTRYVPPDIQFNPPGQLFTNQLIVALVNHVGAGTIRYTTDGSAPTSASAGYAVPLPLTAAATIRARVFLNTFPISEEFSETYARVYAFGDDGVPFAWREQYFGPGFLTNPCAAAGADCDDDGYSVTEEYQYTTDPTDGDSAPEILLTVRVVPKLTFTTIPGRSYRIDRTTTLNPPDWQTIVESVQATGAELHYVDEEAPDNSFYRIELIQD